MNQDREPVTLSAERGHPVVLAFPAAFSGVYAGIVRSATALRVQ